MVSVWRRVALCLLLSVCAEVVAAQTCNPVHYSALQYFYREIPYPLNTFLTWKADTDCCSWSGVTCDGSGNVVLLSLSNADTNPPYPAGSNYVIGSGLSGLSTLTSLSFKNIGFDGAIPGSWGNLVGLKNLTLESCSVVGPLPAELCKLNQLERFNIFDNLFSGAIPACFNSPSATFPSIKEFNITKNNFS